MLKCGARKWPDARCDSYVGTVGEASPFFPHTQLNNSLPGSAHAAPDAFTPL